MDTPAQNDPSAPAPVITSNTAAEDKGKSLKKVAIILGGFIVLIIISELAYLGYTRYLSPKKAFTPTQEAEGVVVHPQGAARGGLGVGCRGRSRPLARAGQRGAPGGRPTHAAVRELPSRFVPADQHRGLSPAKSARPSARHRRTRRRRFWRRCGSCPGSRGP